MSDPTVQPAPAPAPSKPEPAKPAKGVKYGEGIDPVVIEQNMAHGDALVAAVEKIESDTNLERARIAAAAAPPEQAEAVQAQVAQVEAAADKANRKARRLSTISAVSEDELAREARGYFQEQARAAEAQHASLVARAGYLRRLLNVSGADALEGDERASVEAEIAQIDRQIPVQEEVTVFLQQQRDSYPPLPEGVGPMVTRNRGPRGRREV